MQDFNVRNRKINMQDFNVRNRKIIHKFLMPLIGKQTLHQKPNCTPGTPSNLLQNQIVTDLKVLTFEILGKNPMGLEAQMQSTNMA